MNEGKERRKEGKDRRKGKERTKVKNQGKGTL